MGAVQVTAGHDAALRPARSRARWYPVVAALVALGSPLGLLVVRACLQGRWPSLAWVVADLAACRFEYAYLTIATAVVMAAFGRVLGRHEDRLAATAATDPLTGLWNRRQLAIRIDEELARAGRQAAPVALLVIDVDGLKQINDRGSHAAGDDALVRVAEAMRASCRAADVPARWGGDEFAVLAPGVRADAAVELAERICRAVRARGLAVSIGVADLDDVAGGDGLALYRAADRALYLAKQGGRDRVATLGRDLA